MALHDADLVARAPAEPACEAELCRRFAPRIRRYGLRHLRDEAAAADLVQSVLVILLEGLRAGRLRDPSRLGSFVLGTCRLVVLDLRRGERRRHALLETYGEDLAPSPAVPAEPDRARLGACLEGLNERERTVVALTFYAGKEAAEIAGAIGMTLGNVRVVRHRALARLQSCLGVDP